MHPLQRIGMAAPSRRYLAAVIDPLNRALTVNAKVPTGPAQSQSVPVVATVDVTIGTNGVGWIACTPNIVGRDAYTFTNAAYTGTAIQGMNRARAYQAGITGGVIAKPYSKITLDGSYSGLNSDKAMAFRLVAAGIQGTYIGAAQNRAGVCFALHTTTNDDISSVSPSVLQQSEPIIAKYNVNTHDLYTAAWRAKTPHEMDFRDTTSQITSDFGYGSWPSCTSVNSGYWDYSYGDAGGYGCSYGLMWSGCVPGTVFTCTIGESWEFVGGSVGLLATPIYHDVAGLAHVNTIAHSVDMRHAQEPHISRTDHTINAIEDIAGALEPEMALAASAMFGPAGGAAVEGFNSVMHKARDPINHLMGEGISALRDIFHL